MHSAAFELTQPRWCKRMGGTTAGDRAQRTVGPFHPQCSVLGGTLLPTTYSKPVLAAMEPRAHVCAGAGRWVPLASMWMWM